jgi:hypothetical protein
MSKLLAALLAATAVDVGCAPSVSLAPGDLERLRAGSGTPVVHLVSRAPQVDCPGDWGEQTWSAPGGGLGMESRPPSTLRLAEYSPAARKPVRLAGSVWQDVQDQRTGSLRRAPPRDPARATGDGFLSLSQKPPRPAPFPETAVPVESVDRRALEGRFGASPVLVFETTRWVLVGCFDTYQPWFSVRATLLDLASGKVLWREACGGLYPPDPSAQASPAELEANGKALYARMLDVRAEHCAKELFESFRASLRRAG